MFICAREGSCADSKGSKIKDLRRGANEDRRRHQLIDYGLPNRLRSGTLLQFDFGPAATLFVLSENLNFAESYYRSKAVLFKELQRRTDLCYCNFYHPCSGLLAITQLSL